MKKLIILSFPCLFVQVIKGQSLPDKFKDFDIKKTSYGVFRAIKNEVTGNASEPEKNALAELQQGSLTPEEFSATITKVSDAQAIRTGVYKVGTEVTKYLTSVAFNYVSMDQGVIGKWLAPAISQSVGLASDWMMSSVADQHKDQMNNVVKNYFTLLRNKGQNISNVNSEQEFNTVFAIAKNEVNLTGDNYSFFNQQLQQAAFKFLKECRGNIKNLEQRVQAGEQNLQGQLNDLRSQIEGLSITDQAEFENFKNSLRSEVQASSTSIRADIQTKFDAVRESMVVLVENDKKVLATLNQVKQRINVNEVKIKNLEKKMEDVKKEMEINKNNIGELKKRTDTLAKIQAEHSKLIAMNMHQTSILSGYVFNSLDAGEKLKALERGDFDFIYTKEQKEQLVKELTEINEKETFTRTVNMVLNKMSQGVEFAQSAADMLISTGIIKGKDAKIVARSVNDLTNAVNIVSGIGKMYAGDYSGIINVMNGISGFSKRGSGAAASPEMQMLQQMFKVMNERFDAIDMNLVKISQQISSLSNNVAEMNKNMMLSFQYLGKEIDRVIWKQDNQAEILKNFVFQQYNYCAALERSRIADSNNLTRYEQYVKLSNLANCPRCLEGLYSFIVPDGYEAKFKMSAAQAKESAIEREIRTVYEPTLKFFSSFYKEDKKALLALMFPVERTKESSIPIEKIKSLQYADSVVLEHDYESIKTYYNYMIIPEFAKYYSTYQGFFEIYGNTISFEPMALASVFSAGTFATRKAEIAESLGRLLKMTDAAIIQQSLVSGNLLIKPLYYSLFTYNENKEQIKLATEVLNGNQVLAANFATNLVNRNLDVSDADIVKLINSAQDGDTVAAKKLSGRFLLDKGISVKYDKDYRKLFLVINRDGNEAIISFPRSAVLQSDYMISTEYLKKLISTRNQLCESIAMVDFSETVNNQDILKKIKYSIEE